MLEGKAVIGRSIVGGDRRCGVGVIGHETLQRLRIGVPNHLRRNLFRLPILGTDYGRLANRAASAVLQSLALVLDMFRRRPPK